MTTQLTSNNNVGKPVSLIIYKICSHSKISMTSKRRNYNFLFGLDLPVMLRQIKFEEKSLPEIKMDINHLLSEEGCIYELLKSIIKPRPQSCFSQENLMPGTGAEGI